MGENKKILIISSLFLILSLFIIAVYAANSASDITNIAKFGTTTLNHKWKTITHNGNFSNPVVIAKPIGIAGGQPAHIRIRNISANSFQVRVEEWLYLDDWHVVETISYMVMDTGTYLINGKKIEAGTILTTNSWSTGYFNENFTTTPVLLTQSQTTNEADPITTRNRNIGTTSFQVKVQEEENATAGGNHTSETIGYIAAEIGLYNNATRVEVGKTSDSVTHRWYTINFNQTYNGNPSFLADMQTDDGDNTANVRYNNIGNSSVQVQIDEEQSKDSEVSHTTEVVGYFVLQ